MTGKKSRFLRLLGTPALFADGNEIVLPEKAYALLVFLVTAPQFAMDREVLRSILWQSDQSKQRAGSLRQLLARIDRGVPEEVPRLLKATNTHVFFNHEDWAADVLMLSNMAAPLPRPAWDLFRGDLLEGFKAPTMEAEERVVVERQRVEQRREAHIVALLDAPEKLTSDDILLLAGLLIDADPANEIACRALMQMHSQAGDVAAARQAYSRCRSELKSEYGAEPDAATQVLAHELGIIVPAGLAGQAAPTAASITLDPLGQPRVLILPPDTILSDPVLQRVGRALLEEVTIGLSQQRGFKVIAAHTSLEIVNRSVTGALSAPTPPELRFDYTVYVTIHGREDDIYATCRLTKTSTAEVLWAIDLPLAIQKVNQSFGQLARRIVMTLADTIERRELLDMTHDVNPSAYRLYLEGKRLVSKTDLQHLRQARKWFKSALARHDRFSSANAGMARVLGMEWLVRGMKDTQLLEEADRFAWLARDNDPNSGRAMRELGFVALYRRRFGDSLDFFAEAQMLNPNDADILADHADALLHDGQSDRALELSLAALKLNPLPPDYYYWNLGGIHFVQENYAKAIEVLDRVKDRPATSRLLAAAHAKNGDRRAASRYASIVLENFPDFRTDDVWQFVPDRNPDDTRQLIDGLRMAGLS
ncbi:MULTISPECIES: BTAD domain-containing putative transcriptional regulator [unclassified Rhizobium]|uniref:BTAD domain-containing putative transcriptional regulator n=1 Tax=unclassified Rhizobium TaxID=2613769 RepID=UPI00161A0E46|nr:MULTISPECIES: BTAD domain-containing putative transcriptional regulator [unclassified Rhizobium]MBB3320281.1 DNA-binding SARP family transcriptional activator/tetratricopeptide (TPR) repeat protein [Rhizobium sp. BK181]MCS4096037.1 DNA-binding SARP family transcriptional activator/tetratricopeptide (TPR) repeat protein [Rhizobium sp. BK176]